MGILYIAGSTQGAGATAVCAALAAHWRQAGKSVSLHKPFSFNADADGRDAALFAHVSGQATDRVQTRQLEDWQVNTAQVDALSTEMAMQATDADVVLIEGLPLTDQQGAPLEASAMVARKLGAEVIGVVPYAPDMEAEASEAWQRSFGDALVGLMVNRCTRYAGRTVKQDVAPALHRAGVRFLGAVPEDRTMLAPTVRQVADHLQARVLTGTSEEQRLVEQFIIGGLILEWGGNYFGRFPRQAVIARGGRADISMAALNFPMSCLVLTACSEPSQYVYQRADEQEVPLLVVEAPTLEAAAALDTINQRVSVHHPAKIERFTDLLATHLDWEATDSAAGFR